MTYPVAEMKHDPRGPGWRLIFAPEVTNSACNMAGHEARNEACSLPFPGGKLAVRSR
jgi:hypothetical protein